MQILNCLQLVAIVVTVSALIMRQSCLDATVTNRNMSIYLIRNGTSRLIRIRVFRTKTDSNESHYSDKRNRSEQLILSEFVSITDQLTGGLLGKSVTAFTFETCASRLGVLTQLSVEQYGVR